MWLQMKKNMQRWGEKVSDELTKVTLTDRPLVRGPRHPVKVVKTGRNRTLHIYMSIRWHFPIQGVNFDESVEKLRNSIHQTYDTWRGRSRRLLRGFARKFEPMVRLLLRMI